MIKENQMIPVSMTPATQEWYHKLGYEYKLWEKFKVPPQDLPITSHHKIKCICEECGVETEIQYRYYYNHIKRFGEYKCAICINKAEETNKKRIATTKKTLLERYGATSTYQIEGVREKMIATCRKKYGVDYSTQSEQMKQKSKQTLEAHGNVRVSKPQLKVYDILKNKYPEVKENTSCGPYNLDCELNIDGINIDIEYDGAFWHQNLARDRQRDGYFKHNHYKILRIKGGSLIPSPEDIYVKIDLLLHTDSKYEEIILPDWEKFQNRLKNT